MGILADDYDVERSFVDNVLSWDPSSIAMPFSVLPEDESPPEGLSFLIYRQQQLVPILDEARANIFQGLEQVKNEPSRQFSIKFVEVKKQTYFFVPESSGSYRRIRLVFSGCIPRDVERGLFHNVLQLDCPLADGTTKSIFALVSSDSPQQMSLMVIMTDQEASYFLQHCKEGDVELPVTYITNVLSHQRMYSACQSEAENSLLIQAIEGKVKPPCREEEWQSLPSPSPSEYPDYLNAIQRRAAWSFHRDGERDISVVQGPPGTGKTLFITGVAEMSIRENRHVYIMAPSNKAMHENVLRFIAKNSRAPIVILSEENKLPDSLKRYSLRTIIQVLKTSLTELSQRIGQLLEVRLELLSLDYFDPIVFELSKILEVVWHHSLLPLSDLERLEQLSKSIDEEKSKGEVDSAENIKNSFLMVARILKNSDVDVNKIYRLKFSIIMSCPVVFSTLSACATADGLSVISKTDDIIIDEACQAMDPELFIVFRDHCAFGEAKLLLVGDHKQLPPTVISREHRDFLTHSLVRKLMTASPDSYMTLTTQYRMHPDILLFPCHRYYGGMVETAEEVALAYADAQPANPLDSPYAIFDIVGEEGLNDDKSYYNYEEIWKILDIIRCHREKFKDDSRIGVITPYQGQVIALSQALLRESKKGKPLGDVFVSTVDGFQGGEEEIIIYSAVRSNQQGNIGFSGDPYRLNVALTRARRRFVMVANVTTLEQERHVELAALFTNARERGCLHSAQILQDIVGEYKPKPKTGRQRGRGRGRGRRGSPDFWSDPPQPSKSGGKGPEETSKFYGKS